MGIGLQVFFIASRKVVFLSFDCKKEKLSYNRYFSYTWETM